MRSHEHARPVFSAIHSAVANMSTLRHAIRSRLAPVVLTLPFAIGTAQAQDSESSSAGDIETVVVTQVWKKCARWK
jgi:hypothetical protein